MECNHIPADLVWAGIYFRRVDLKYQYQIVFLIPSSYQVIASNVSISSQYPRQAAQSTSPRTVKPHRRDQKTRDSPSSARLRDFVNFIRNNWESI